MQNSAPDGLCLSARTKYAVPASSENRVEIAGKSPNNVNRNSKEYEVLHCEWQMLRRLSHEYIVKYIGFIEFQRPVATVPPFVLLLEKCYEKNLKKVILAPNMRYSLLTILYWAKQMFSALEYLRTQNIVHQDLKAENTLLHCQQKTGQKRLLDVRICDFGSARDFEHTTTFPVPVQEYSVGTEMYWAPETCEERKTCHRTDIFQLGTVLYELVERRNCLLNEKTREPPQLSCDEGIQKLVYHCTRSFYEQRPSHAQEVEAKLDAMLQDYQKQRQNGARLELEVEELNGRGQGAPETPIGCIRPPQLEIPGFDWLGQPIINNPAAETFTERIKGDAGCEDADFHRKYFRKIIYDDLRQIDLQIDEIVNQHRGNYAKLLKFPSEMQNPSHNLRLSEDEQRFEKMLIADFNYQAKLFQLIFEVLIDTAKVPIPPESSRNPDSETHFSYGCWDLFELLKERDESLVKFIEFGYSIEFEFDCFIIRTSSGPKPCTFLAVDDTGSLVKYEENGVKVLVYLEGGITNERIVSQANPLRTKTGCEELQELVANGMKQLHAATIFYHRSLSKEFRFQVDNYMFQLKWPPSHTHNCVKSQPIQKVGFPKEIDCSERIGICSCIQGCADSESLIEVYTKICKLFFFVKRKGAEMLRTPYEGRHLRIRFDEIWNHRDWHFHWHGTEERLILDHPESYDQPRIEMSIDCDYGFGCLPVSRNQLENQRKTLGVHELFNVNQHSSENKFFRFGPT